MTMPEMTCPACGKVAYGWSLKYQENPVCPYCGAPMKEIIAIDDDFESGLTKILNDW